MATHETVHYAEPVDNAGTHASPPDEQPAAAAEQNPQSARPKILVADDNEMNALALEDYLTAVGYDLYFAGDGEQALEHAEEVGPDLILMDIQMPRSAVWKPHAAFSRQARRFVDTPILALTALAMPGDRELCLAAGASAYIAKPFLLKDLVRTIREWLPAQ